jgi:hypothetical protein
MRRMSMTIDVMVDYLLLDLLLYINTKFNFGYKNISVLLFGVYIESASIVKARDQYG